jgi:hypothetical protein
LFIYSHVHTILWIINHAPIRKQNSTTPTEGKVALFDEIASALTFWFRDFLLITQMQWHTQS